MKNIKKLSFYEVNPRYFKDYSASGVGDITGLVNKIDYFKYLGVDVISIQDLLSVDMKDEKFPSYTKVASDIGDANSMIKLISVAKDRGIKVVFELKIGSVGEEHNWFKAAELKEAVGYDEMIKFHPKNDGSNSEQTEFKYSSEAKQYYLVDTRTREIPLNWKSEQVLEGFVEVIKFWKDLGVDGFVLKDFEFVGDFNRREAMNDDTKRELRKLYNSIKSVDNSLMVIGKSDVVPIAMAGVFTQGELQIFDYFLSTSPSTIGLDKKWGRDHVGRFSPSKLAQAIKAAAQSPSIILTFDSRNYGRVVSRWGDDLQFVKESAKGIAMLQMLTKASSNIYYGNELGLPNIGLTHLDDFQDEDLDERKAFATSHGLSEEEFYRAQVLQGPLNARALMPWNADKNGGFSFSSEPISPAIYAYQEINVENQYKDEYSVLNFYKKLIEFMSQGRNASVIKNGTPKVSSKVPGVIKVVFRNGNSEVIIYVNTTSSNKPIRKFGTGKVVMSNLERKEYHAIPKKLEAYEAIVISKNTDEYIKETQAIKLAELKRKEKEVKEAQKAKDEAEKAKREAREAELALKQEKAEAAALAKEEAAKAKEEALAENDSSEKDRMHTIEDTTNTQEIEKEEKDKEKEALAEEKASLEREAIRQAEKEQAQAEKEKANEEKEKLAIAEAERKEAIKAEIELTKEILLTNKEIADSKIQKSYEIEEKLQEVTQQISLEGNEPSEEVEKKLDDIAEYRSIVTATKKENDDEIKTTVKELKKELKHGEMSAIEIAKLRAQTEKKISDRYKDEATLLKEEELAKTTLISDDFDLDELFGNDDLD